MQLRPSILVLIALFCISASASRRVVATMSPIMNDAWSANWDTYLTCNLVNISGRNQTVTVTSYHTGSGVYDTELVLGTGFQRPTVVLQAGSAVSWAWGKSPCTGGYNDFTKAGETFPHVLAIEVAENRGAIQGSCMQKIRGNPPPCNNSTSQWTSMDIPVNAGRPF